MKRQLLAALLAAGTAASLGAGKRQGYVQYTPPSRGFACELPAEWTPFESETLRGRAVHVIGPPEADGLWRVSYHIHHFEKGRPGFIRARQTVSAARKGGKAADRVRTQPYTMPLRRKPARIFEVSEERLLPPGRLPSAPVRLHHFYAVIASGKEEYFMIKLSTTEETYLDYRKEFRRFLKSFRVIGY